MEQETWVLYDENRKPIGKEVPRYAKLEKHEYAFGVHVWIKSNGKYLIFRRDKSKKRYPNLFDMIGGGVNGHDSPLYTAIKETKEESGLDLNPNDLKLVFISKVDYEVNGNIYPEHTHVYMAEINDLKISDIQIEVGKNCDPQFLSKEEILKLIDDKLFIPIVIYRDKIEELF